MMKKLSLIGATLAMTAGATLAAAPANAQYYGDRSYQGGGYYQAERGDYGSGYDRREYGDAYGRRGYDDLGYASQRYAQRGYGQRNYYGRNSYSYRCSKGTAGTILGAIVGGLLGDAVVGRRGDGTAGAIVGAGVGALAGRSIERSNSRC